MNNLGYAYTKLQEKGKGLKLMQDALAMSDKENDSYGRIESYLCLSEYYLPYNLEKSRSFATKSLRDSPTIRVSTLRLSTPSASFSTSAMIAGKYCLA